MNVTGRGMWASLTGILLLLSLSLAGCRSARHTTATEGSATADGARLVETLVTRTPGVDCVDAKMRFALTVGDKDFSVGGNLRMKRDEVIQLSLVGFGIIEGGRLEFTPDSVLVIDRINRQYVSAAYEDFDFLREAEVDFYTLQALFWNELVLPGVPHVTTDDAASFRVRSEGGKTVLTGHSGRKLSYEFMTSPTGGELVNTEIRAVRPSSPYRLNWAYSRFSNLGGGSFPTQMDIALSGLKRPATVNISLNRLSANDGWSKRTSVSKRYRRVSVDEILTLLLKL